MSRRNYKVEQSYIEWLKSLGCVLYSPLTEGDLTDNISGASWLANQNASISWDNQQGAYLFDMLSNVPAYKGIELPNIGIDLGNTMDSTEYTCVIDVNVDSSVRGQTPILLTDRHNWNLSWTYGDNASGRWIRLVGLKILGDRKTYQYEDGTLVIKSDQNVGDDNGVLLFARPGWNNQRFTAHAKGAYVFSKALNFETINKLI